MPLRLGALHDALLDPGNAEKAQKAAEEVAIYQTDMHEIRVHLTKVDGRLDWLMWMVGALIALQIALGVGNLFLTLNVLSRLPQ
jgi:hypothetical protein